MSVIIFQPSKDLETHSPDGARRGSRGASYSCKQQQHVLGLLGYTSRWPLFGLLRERVVAPVSLIDRSCSTTPATCLRNHYQLSLAREPPRKPITLPRGEGLSRTLSFDLRDCNKRSLLAGEGWSRAERRVLRLSIIFVLCSEKLLLLFVAPVSISS